jgi:hypothetical protein
MNHGETLTRALAIAWRHPYLWLLALFAGEGGISGLPNLQGSSGARNDTGVTPTPDQVASWVAAHAALVGAAAVAAAFLLIIALAVSALAGGALIRAAAEHDRERPFGLGPALRAGVCTFWPVLQVRLFAVLVTLVLLVAIGSLAAVALAGAAGGHVALAAGAGATAAMLLLLAIPAWIVFALAILLATRAIVLDGRRPAAALAAGFGLIRRRLGRVAAAWLLVGMAGVAGGAAIGVAVMILALPLAGVLAAAAAAGAVTAAVGLGAVAACNLLVLVLAVSGGLNAFVSTFWTLAYSRLDREPRPVLARGPQPAT